MSVTLVDLPNTVTVTEETNVTVTQTTQTVSIQDVGVQTTDASLLVTGTLNNARLPASATTITTVGSLTSLIVEGTASIGSDLDVDGKLNVQSGSLCTDVFNQVGIGTFNPSSKLQVVGTVTATEFNGPLTGTASNVANSTVISKVLTGYTSGAGTVSATDTLLQAIQKLNGNIVAMNGYDRGLMATPATTTTSDTTITAEELQLSYSFTAVSGRTYQFVYIEPSIYGSASGIMYARIRESTVAYGITGTVLNTTTAVIPTLTQTMHRVEAFYTAVASGTYYIVATLQASAGTGQANRSSVRFPLLYALDVGIV